MKGLSKVALATAALYAEGNDTRRPPRIIL